MPNSNYSELSKEILKIIEKEKERTANLPLYFNLLSSFGLTHETGHSRVIADLLKPHPRYPSFLAEFLSKVDIKIDLTGKEIFIKCEQHANGRFIDIFIQIGDDTCIIIENKIRAGDQQTQLQDYYNYAVKEFEEQNIHTLYLTLNGKSPTDYSLGELEPTKVKRISYEKHILEWLEAISSLLYAKFPHEDIILKSALEQYMLTVKILTKQEENRDMTHEKLYERIRTAGKEELEQAVNDGVHQCEQYLCMMKIFEIHKKFGGEFVSFDEVLQRPVGVKINQEIFAHDVPYFCGVTFSEKKIVIIFIGGTNQYQIIPFDIEGGSMILRHRLTQRYDTSYREHLKYHLENTSQ